MEKNGDELFFLDVGSKLRGARNRLKLTQEQVSEETGIPQPFISDIEKGKKSACLRQVVLLSKFYGISYDEVFGGTFGNISLKSGKEEYRTQKYIMLLKEMISGSGSPELDNAAELYLKICVYIMFRTIYRENPRNSDKIYSIDYKEAIENAIDVVVHTPENLSIILSCEKNINKKGLEVPVEDSADLRAFIDECERLLKKTSPQDNT